MAETNPSNRTVFYSAHLPEVEIPPLECEAVSQKSGSITPSTLSLDPPKVTCVYTQFNPQQLKAYLQGDLYGCFGAGFEYAQTHIYSPRYLTQSQLYFDEISLFQPHQQNHATGYLKALEKIPQGTALSETLFREAGLQACAFYLAAIGFTLARDCWRFEPIFRADADFQCQSSYKPQSDTMIVEAWVEACAEAPLPYVYMTMVITMDERVLCKAHGLGLQGMPDWPMSYYPDLVNATKAVNKPAAHYDNFYFDDLALLAAAWGSPVQAFGKLAEPFGVIRKSTRLPGPPYLFLSRVIETRGEIAVMAKDSGLIAEYDIPADAWYKEANSKPQIPFCVLSEAGFQASGWLSTYMGSPLTREEDLFCRVLDGRATFFAEVPESISTLTIQADLTNIAHMGELLFLRFKVNMFAGNTAIFAMETGFGYFLEAALQDQPGINTNAKDLEHFQQESNCFVDLNQQPEFYFNGPLALPKPALLMLDRISGYWPGQGKGGLCQLRGERDVNYSDWFFKAHFFQDPVQPGSLGLQAVIQLMQFYAIHQGLHQGMKNPRFEEAALQVPMAWQFRSEVRPHHKTVTTLADILEVVRDDRGICIKAQGSVWVDGKQIYRAMSLAIRVVDSG